jgi:hypothetical protein
MFIYFMYVLIVIIVFDHLYIKYACVSCSHQNMQSLLGFDSRINKHPGLGTP